ncbi:unnamed protein product [Dimorphilus gyrociliatus]|uniref:Uncharacterized protein n=1 Tax=Dimorphilus gyrociliatus TaxID=2664684 RepID=A0A7I8VF32_9ANNE|nr:unnamed protein product [Dimorphilus gyrociliatus]
MNVRQLINYRDLPKLESYTILRQMAIETLQTIDIVKQTELSKINNEKMNLIEKLQGKENSLKDEIEKFYTNKKSLLNMFLDEITTLEEYEENQTNIINDITINELHEKLEKSLKFCIKNKAIFEKIDNLVDNFQIGNICFPILNNPDDEECYTLNINMKKIISNSITFFGLSQMGNIFDLTMKTFYRTSHLIKDICITYNGKLSFIANSRSGRLTLYILSDCNHITHTIAIPTDKKRFSYDVLEREFILYESNLITFVSLSNGKQLRKLELNDTRFYNHRIFGDSMFISLQDRIITIKLDSLIREDVIINMKSENFNLRRAIVEKIKNGQFLLSNPTDLYVIDPIKKSASSYQTNRIFRNENLLDYRITNQKVIFCYSSLQSNRIFTFKHFRLDFIDYSM